MVRPVTAKRPAQLWARAPATFSVLMGVSCPALSPASKQGAGLRRARGCRHAWPAHGVHAQPWKLSNRTQLLALTSPHRGYPRAGPTPVAPGSP